MTSPTRTKSFIWDDEREGWKPESSPQFDAGGGFLVAHDTMEHFNDSSDFEHELLAFGSIVYGRMYHSNNIINVASSDLANFLFEQKFQVKECNKHWDRPLSKDDEISLNAFIKLTKEKIEYVRSSSKFLYGTTHYSSELIETAVKNAVIWIRLGWRIADRRFSQHERDDVQDAYLSIMFEVNKDHDKNPPKKGDRLIVHFHPYTLKFELERGQVKQHHEKIAA